MVRSLWLVLTARNGIISRQQAAVPAERVMAHLADAILPRKEYQPVSGWARLTENTQTSILDRLAQYQANSK